MLWVLKRTVSMRWFFWTPKTYVKTDGWKDIHNFTVEIMLVSIMVLLGIASVV